MCMCCIYLNSCNTGTKQLFLFNNSTVEDRTLAHLLHNHSINTVSMKVSLCNYRSLIQHLSSRIYTSFFINYWFSPMQCIYASGARIATGTVGIHWTNSDIRWKEISGFNVNNTSWEWRLIWWFLRWRLR